MINRVLDSKEIDRLHIILSKQSELDTMRAALNLDEERNSRIDYYIMEQES
mgnify:CR=1 FL=1